MPKVIACIDGTNVTNTVCDYAAWASSRMEMPLQLLHVLDKSEFPIESDLSGNLGLGSRKTLLDELSSLDERRGRLALEQGRLLLSEAKERVIDKGVEDPSLMQRHGNLLETLMDMEADIELLVLGKHDENLFNHVGSRIESVVRTVNKPILITTGAYVEPKRIMIAFDGSATTRKVVETVAASNLLKDLPCHLVMVGDQTKSKTRQLEWAKNVLETAGFEAPTALVIGEVEKVLCDYRAAQDIDLLVMGAYGHSSIRRFLVGSTTTSVVRDAAVPVLLLR